MNGRTDEFGEQEICPVLESRIHRLFDAHPRVEDDERCAGGRRTRDSAAGRSLTRREREPERAESETARAIR